MIGRRGFLKAIFGAIFGASLGAMTRGVGGVVEALTTRKAAKQVLNVVTASQILEAKMFVIPYIPLMTPVVPKEQLHVEG